jgi:hypothetical protein
MARKEMKAQLSLQILDLKTEWGLLNAQSFCRFGHVPLLSNGNKIAQMSEFH